MLARSLGYTSDAAEDRDGCLQDVHWYGVSTVGGGFQSYTIGNILGVQFYAAAIKAHPGIPREIAKGEFGTKPTGEYSRWNACTNKLNTALRFSPCAEPDGA